MSTVTTRIQRLSPACVMCAAVLAGGCATIPPDALQLSPDSTQRREMQTRKYEGIDDKHLMAASSGVLQDLGFNIDESEVTLGVVVGSKDRSAITPGQVAAAVLVALLGVPMDIDRTQKIRVSLVVRPVSADLAAETSRDFYVRVTFQRIVRNTAGAVTRIEAVDEAEIYQQFFEKLSGSIFLEGQRI
jgi:hypothetical protein